MAGSTTAFRDQVSDLIDFYVQRNRLEAATRLLDDLESAKRAISAEPDGGLSSPRPYPELARSDHRWRLFRAYWIVWKTVGGRPVLTNVFHVSADIPNRATADTDGIEEW